MKKNIIIILTVLLLIFVNNQNLSYAQDNEKDYEINSLNQTN